eukprot:scaffold22531_cov28-Phaeocystis_antarctica.AAC.1
MLSAPGSGEAPVVRGDAPGWGWGVRLRVRVRSREGRRAWQTLVRDGAAAAREIDGRRGEHPLRGRRVGLGRRRGQATGELVSGCSEEGCADEVLPG